MKLNSDTAERIVLLVAQAVDRGVSVTDTAAHVLASTDSHLVGSQHAPAERAMASGGLVEDAVGPLAGISLALVYDNQIIGALVLDDTSQHGRETIYVAKTLAEMVVHQTAVIEALPRESWARDKFIADLLRERLDGSPEAVLQEAGVLRIDLRIPRVVVVVDIAPAKDDAENHALPSSLPRIARALHADQLHARLLEQAQQAITTHEHDVYSFVDEHSLILLATVDPAAPDERRRRIASEAQALLEKLKHDHGVVTSAGIGQYYPGWQALPHSFTDARCALETGEGLRVSGKVYLLDDLGLASFVCSDDQRLKTAMARHLIAPLADEPELLATLATFLEQGLSPSRAADALHIHRHTLAYRLDKIAHLTGLDARKFDAAAQLYAALVLWKVSRGRR